MWLSGLTVISWRLKSQYDTVCFINCDSIDVRKHHLCGQCLCLFSLWSLLLNVKYADELCTQQHHLSVFVSSSLRTVDSFLSYQPVQGLGCRSALSPVVLFSCSMQKYMFRFIHLSTNPIICHYAVPPGSGREGESGVTDYHCTLIMCTKTQHQQHLVTSVL